MDLLENHIEALIFCSQNPISFEEIQECLSEMFESSIPMDDIEKAVLLLEERYADNKHSFEISRIAGGFQFMTKPAYQVSIGIFLKQKSKKRLSTSALETLAIIAYKQPIIKSEIEQIRGVNCDYSVQKLLDKELIEIRGKSDGIGKPILYGTSEKFMEYFGINAMNELPTPKDFINETNQIGEINEA